MGPRVKYDHPRARLGLKVVVEGVETTDQLAKLKELGCDLAQGYYSAKPLASEAAERLLVEGCPVVEKL